MLKITNTLLLLFAFIVLSAQAESSVSNSSSISSSQVLENPSSSLARLSSATEFSSSLKTTSSSSILSSSVQQSSSSSSPKISSSIQSISSESKIQSASQIVKENKENKEKLAEEKVLVEKKVEVKTKATKPKPAKSSSSSSVAKKLSSSLISLSSSSVLNNDSIIQESIRDSLTLKLDSSLVAKDSVIAPMGLKQATQHLKTKVEETSTVAVFTISKVIVSLLVLLVSWLVLRYVIMLLNLMSERWPKYRLQIKGFIPVIQILGWTSILGFIVVGVIRPPIESVLAFTASAGIAIGFASQDLLKNVFAGIMILFDRPFKVGDKIQIDSHYGEVIGIGLRTVRMVTADDSMISIPNSEIVNKAVSNSNSGEPDCQVVAEFWLSQNVDHYLAEQLARKCAMVSRYIYLDKPVAVIFKAELSEQQVFTKMRLKAYVLDHRFENAFASDMTKIVLKEFRKAGIL